MGKLFTSRRAFTTLAMSATAVPLTGTLTETALATVPIPIGALAANSMLRITALWSFVNSTADNKFVIIRLAGVSGDAYFSNNYTNTLSLETVTHIWGRTLTSQLGKQAGLGQAGGSSTSANKTSSRNMATAIDLVLNGQLVTSTANTITLEAYIVELMAG